MIHPLPIVVFPAGVDPSSDLFVKSLLKLHKDSRGTQWDYRPVMPASRVLDCVATCPEDGVILLDIDSDDGRLGWYTIRAMHTGTVGLITAHPERYEGEQVITKPIQAKELLNFFEAVLVGIDHRRQRSA